jgi:hypothetical protein
MEVPYKIFGAVMLAFGFYGLFSIRNKRLQSLILVICVYSTLVSAIFFVQTRHRILKVDPFLIPLAIIGIASVVATFRNRSQSKITGNSLSHHGLKTTVTEL